MNQKRYSELDWLRVILILAVFLHHVFMPFNGDGWHIMNSESSKRLDDIMVYFEQLRLHTLFFIAGAGSFLLLNKLDSKAFIWNKFHRLFIPLLVGVILIVPPQSYYEEINNYTNLLDAYQQTAFSFSTNHLWFIEFLIVFMLLAVGFKKLLNKPIGSRIITKLESISSSKHGLFSLVIFIALLRGGLKLILPEQDHKIENLSLSLFYLVFFIAGMLFINSHKIWHSLVAYRANHFKWFIFSTVLFYAYYFSPDLSDYASLTVRWQIWWLLCTMVSWSGLLVLLGYAIGWCKQTPKWLYTANELIYPFYILHQTIIIALAYYIVQWDAGIGLKSISLLISSLIICSLICYFVIKPVTLFRYLFGLKTIKNKS